MKIKSIEMEILSIIKQTANKYEVKKFYLLDYRLVIIYFPEPIED